MALTKTIEIDGKQVTFRASAAVPRQYRIRYRRDIFVDLKTLSEAMEGQDQEHSGLDKFSLEIFENIAHCMARHADPKGVPDSPDEWLDQFQFFSIYQILPEILELWGLNVEQQVESKKNFARVSGK